MPAAEARAGAVLVPKDIQAVDAVTAAWFQGNSAAALSTLVPLIARLDGKQLAAVDARLAERNVPPAGQLLADARLALVQQGLADQLPKVQVREAVLVLPALEEEAIRALDLKKRSAVMVDPLPMAATVEEYEHLLWDVHVLRNRLEASLRAAQYTARVAQSVNRQQAARLDEAERAVLERDYAHDAAELADSIRQLDEREIELRIARLFLARDTLERPELTRERFLAAYTAPLDAARALEFLEQARSPFQRSALNIPGLAKRITEAAAGAQQLAGDLQLKSQLFFEGVHWWIRGRYGLGPDVFGLAKSPAAMHSIEGQMALYMPSSAPTPTDPMVLAKSGSQVPFYDRRHHYWWAWEDRRVARSGFEQTATTTVSTTETKYDTKKGFW
jgi:hypothetical protein